MVTLTPVLNYFNNPDCNTHFNNYILGYQKPTKSQRQGDRAPEVRPMSVRAGEACVRALCIKPLIEMITAIIIVVVVVFIM